MFGIGETELVIIVVFGFLLFGPDKLPGMGRTVGRFLRQFREAQEGFTQVVQAEVMDPLNDVLNEPSKDKEADQAAIDEDSDLEEGAAAKRSHAGETFAERKARLKAEREAREAEVKAAEAEKAAAAEAASTAEAAADAAEPVTAPAAPEGGDVAAEPAAQESAAAEGAAPEAAEPEPEEAPAKPDTSASALYSLTPRKRAAKAEPEQASVEEAVQADPEVAAEAGPEVAAEPESTAQATVGEEGGSSEA